MTKQNPYILDKEAQAHLKQGINTLWQAHALIETIQQAYSDDEHITLNSALNGVLALMSRGLDDLGEI